MTAKPDSDHSSKAAREAMKAYEATFRDRIASMLANGVLNVFATKGYRDALNAVIRAGLIDAAKKGPNPPFTEPLDDPCESCDGEGRIDLNAGWHGPPGVERHHWHPCPDCDGSGQAANDEIGLDRKDGEA